MWKEEINKHLENEADLLRVIYRGGGIKPNGYGFISGGYGGGVDHNEFIDLTFIRGYLMGLSRGSPELYQRLMLAINLGLKHTYPDIKEGNLPFINLDIKEL